MFWRRALSAAGALALLAAASWLPARASGSPPVDRLAGADLARATLTPPTSWPAQPGGPVQAVSAFIWSLSAAVGGNAAPPAPPTSKSVAAPSASGASGPQIGDVTAQPFARAYAYLTPEWQARVPFAAFLSQWTAIRHLDPLAILAAGPPPGGDPRTVRVFVEVRMLASQAAPSEGVSLAFADGFYIAEPSPQGWHLAAGSLRREDFGLGSGSGAAPNAEAAAERAARSTAMRLGRPGAAGPAAVKVQEKPDHQAVVSVRLGEDTYTVRTYRLADGQWVALSAQR